MAKLTDCLELVREVRQSGRDPASAYVQRARVRRSVLVVGKTLADQHGLPSPVLPEDVEKLRSSDPGTAKVFGLCAEVLARSRSLCQPSEALDERWSEGWEEVSGGLERLEELLTETEDT